MAFSLTVYSSVSKLDMYIVHVRLHERIHVHIQWYMCISFGISWYMYVI